MGESMKKRLAIFLSILFVLPTIFAIMPFTATDVQAVDVVKLYWSNLLWGDAASIEEGKTFYIGDYVYVYERNKPYKTLSMVNATYASSEKMVATVDEKGSLTTVAPGKTTITMKYKGETLEVAVTVVEKGTFTNAATEKVKKAVSVFAEVPSKITTKNGFKLQKQVAKYEALIKSDSVVDGTVTVEGFLSSSANLAVPEAGRYLVIDQKLDNFAADNDPMVTKGAKRAKIASIKGSTSQVTMYLKKKLTDSQFLATQIYDRYSSSYNAKKAITDIRVQDTTTGKYYYAHVFITKNNKKVTVKLYNVKYNANYTSLTYKYNIKFKKGHTYVLGTKTTWPGGKKVKIK